MDTIDTIRYMGVKTALLDKIVPAIQRVTPTDGTVLDIMAGTNSVAYALKRYFTVYTNDVQEYSRTISNAIIVNQKDFIDSKTAKLDLFTNYSFNIKEKHYHFFEETYSGTYFSQHQCADIDSIRYAIEQVSNDNKKNLYLLALMAAMCKVQSTPGHFAQYMPAEHRRIIPLQKMQLLNEFYDKCDNYSNIIITGTENKAFCGDYNDLLSSNDMYAVDTIYLDSPYSQEQYSRFYHILETMVKYDSPKVFYKAKYRGDRFMSNFCYKSKVKNEFRKIINFCCTNHKNLVISYSTNGVFSVDNLISLCGNSFDSTKVEYIDYAHSTQGKGLTKVKEVLLSCSCK
ncbi:MAG: DNA adenine methylase [Clostridia bacterium]|nr:DNA adenine methylase [Clostridia bacterium]